MNNQESYIQVIRAAYPELLISSVDFKDHGQNSDVVVLNNEFIFLFPKYTHVLEGLKIETAILNGIQDSVTLLVPIPLFINLKQKAVGEAFVGYRSIPGEPLWRDTFRMIDDQAIVRKLADQVASFLKSLHNMPVEDAIGIELPASDTYHECADLYSRIREKLFGFMRPDARTWAAQHFEGFLRDNHNFEYIPVLKHGDFGPSNILFDKKMQTITGIIDFGGSGMGDPAYDFAGLLSGYGEGFVAYCANLYPEVEDYMGRIHFYQGTFALLEALFGVENSDERALKAGLERYV